jgi:hypothetical protein
MNSNLTRAKIVSSLTLAALAAGLAGCSTTSYERGDAAGRSLQNAAAEVQIQSRELRFTMSTLETLVNKPAVDLKPQFDTFSKSLNRLQAAVARNQRAAEAVVAKNAEYLASWDRQITNMNYEVVRTRSVERRGEVTDRFEAVSRRYAEARTVMRPLLAYLNDIRLALSSDLTLAGLEAIKPIVSNAGENAGKVQLALARLTTELNDSGVRVSSHGFQTSPNPFVSVSRDAVVKGEGN